MTTSAILPPQAQHTARVNSSPCLLVLGVLSVESARIPLVCAAARESWRSPVAAIPSRLSRFQYTLSRLGSSPVACLSAILVKLPPVRWARRQRAVDDEWRPIRGPPFDIVPNQPFCNVVAQNASLLSYRIYLGSQAKAVQRRKVPAQRDPFQPEDIPTACLGSYRACDPSSSLPLLPLSKPWPLPLGSRASSRKLVLSPSSPRAIARTARRQREYSIPMAASSPACR